MKHKFNHPKLITSLAFFIVTSVCSTMFFTFSFLNSSQNTCDSLSFLAATKAYNSKTSAIGGNVHYEMECIQNSKDVRIKYRNCAYCSFQQYTSSSFVLKNNFYLSIGPVLSSDERMPMSLSSNQATIDDISLLLPVTYGIVGKGENQQKYRTETLDVYLAFNGKYFNEHSNEHTLYLCDYMADKLFPDQPYDEILGESITIKYKDADYPFLISNIIITQANDKYTIANVKYANYLKTLFNGYVFLPRYYPPAFDDSITFNADFDSEYFLAKSFIQKELFPLSKSAFDEINVKFYDRSENAFQKDEILSQHLKDLFIDHSEQDSFTYLDGDWPLIIPALLLFFASLYFQLNMIRQQNQNRLWKYHLHLALPICAIGLPMILLLAFFHNDLDFLAFTFSPIMPIAFLGFIISVCLDIAAKCFLEWKRKKRTMI